MTVQDTFVGTVAIAVGLFALSSAMFNWDWSYRLWTARWVESRFGRRGARIFYTLLGGVMIALGVAIALGFGPNKEQAREEGSRASQVKRVACLFGLFDFGGQAFVVPPLGGIGSAASRTPVPNSA